MRLAVTPATPAVPASRPPRMAARPVPGGERRYVVRLRDDARARRRLGHVAAVCAADGAARAVLAPTGRTPEVLYAHAFRGFAATLGPSDVAALRANPRVVSVSEPKIYHAAGTIPPDQSVANTCLSRVNQHTLPLDALFDWHATGAGINVYQIDSGIRVTHADFNTVSIPGGGGTRATNDIGFVGDGFDVVPGYCSTHGTQVASSIGGHLGGTAREARIHDVRVLDCVDAAPLATLLQGIDWVAANAVRPAVVNMSLGGPPDATLDAAVAHLTQLGLTVIVAGGNASADACGFSPSREPAAIAVGATTAADLRSTTSGTNFGPCLALWACCNANTAANITNDDARSIVFGTSISAGFTTGVVATYLQRFPLATPAQVRAALLAGASSGVLPASVTANNSPNLLLYNNYVPWPAQDGSGNELTTDYMYDDSIELGSWLDSGGVRDNVFSVAEDGTWKGNFVATSDDLSQPAGMLPQRMSTGYADSRKMALRFYLRVITAETDHTIHDALYVRLVDPTAPGGATTIAGYSNLHATGMNGYVSEWITLTHLMPYGRRPAVEFVSAVDGGNATNFLVDTVSLNDVPCSSFSPQLLLNASFESGDNGNWTWTRDAGSVILNAPPVLDGAWAARLGGWSDGVAHVDTLTQTVTLPASVAGQFVLYTRVEGTDATAGDILTIDVRDAGTNALLQRLATYTSLSTHDAWTAIVVSSTASWWRAGRQVKIAYRSVANTTVDATSFYVDALRFTATNCVR